MRAEVASLRRALDSETTGPAVRPEALLSTLTQLRAQNSLLQESLNAAAAAHGAQLRRTLDGGAVPLVLPGAGASSGLAAAMRDDDLDGRIAAEGFAYELEEVTSPSNGADKSADSIPSTAAENDGDDLSVAAATTVVERLVAPEARAALSAELAADAVLDELLASAAVIDSELRSLIAAADAVSPSGELLAPIDDLLSQAAELERAAAEAVAERASAVTADSGSAASVVANASSRSNVNAQRVAAHKAKLEALRQRTQDLESQLTSTTGNGSAAAGDADTSGGTSLLLSVHALAEAVDAALVEVYNAEAVRLDVERAELDHVIALLETDPELGQATELATSLRLEAQRGTLPGGTSEDLLAPPQRRNWPGGMLPTTDTVALSPASALDDSAAALLEAGEPQPRVRSRRADVAADIAAAAVEVAATPMASHQHAEMGMVLDVQPVVVDAVAVDMQSIIINKVAPSAPSSTTDVALAAARAFAQATEGAAAAAVAVVQQPEVAVVQSEAEVIPAAAAPTIAIVDMVKLEQEATVGWKHAIVVAEATTKAAKAAALETARRELARLKAEQDELARLAAEREVAAQAAKVEQQRAAEAVDRGNAERRRLAAEKVSVNAAATTVTTGGGGGGSGSPPSVVSAAAPITPAPAQQPSVAASVPSAPAPPAVPNVTEAAAAAAKRLAEQRQAAAALVKAAATRRAADAAAAAAERRRQEEAAAATERAEAARKAQAQAAAEAEAWVAEQRKQADAKAAAERAAAAQRAAAAAKATEERAAAARAAAARAQAEAQAEKERRAAAAKSAAERAAQRAKAAAERAAAEAAAASQRDTAAAEAAAEMAARMAAKSYETALAAEWKGIVELAESAQGHVPIDDAEASFWRTAQAAASNVPPALARLLDSWPVNGSPALFEDSRFAVVPWPPMPGAPCTVYYAPDAPGGPLNGRPEVILHCGFNSWETQAEIVAPMTLIEEDDEEDESDSPAAFAFRRPQIVKSGKHGRWFEYTLTPFPMKACTLDFVFSDGRSAWDNNNKSDFHVVVNDAAARHAVIRSAKAMESLVAWRDAREKQRQADAARAAQRAARASEARERSLRVVAAQMARHVRTVPAGDPQAGSIVTVLYNPTDTALHGRTDVYIRGGFNRWRHDARKWGPTRMRPASAQELEDASPAGGPVPPPAPGAHGSWFAAEVEVPPDVWSLDFVFSDNGGDAGGTYDNRGTMDYHLPVAGGTVIGRDGNPEPAVEPQLHVVSVSVEMAPIAKVGGLGDVVTSLGRAVMEAGHRMEVILPKYDVLDYSQVANMREERGFNFGGCYNRVYSGEVEGLSTLFIEPQNGMFSCGCIYGADFKPIPLTDAQRFGFFSHAALEFCLQSGRRPDIAHVHDWQTAPVARLYWDCYRHHGLPNTRIVFTIHNLNYGANLVGEAMTYSQRATTVSRTYAGEISGHPVIRPHGSKFRGVVNGIDPDIWDPLNDKFLPVFYDETSHVAGKAAARKTMRQRLGMQDRDAPIVGVVTRLTSQKGIHLIKHAIYKSLERGAQVALLGSAPDPKVQNEFNGMWDDLRRQYNNQAALVFKFDEPLSHLIYAASDLLLVPSMFEPCGLSQLIAMRYGTVPLVRRTGGLADTVFDVDTDRQRAADAGLEPNGFVFEGTDGGAIDWALNRALDMWYSHRTEFSALQRTCMTQDWSWNRPAVEYLELYHAASRTGN